LNRPTPELPYSRHEQRAWYVYDFANSAFASTVVTLFLGPYLTSLARNAADPAGNIFPFGVQVYARSYWSYLISLSVISQVVFLPLLGAVADYSLNKKRLLAVFTYLGGRSLFKKVDVRSARTMSSARFASPQERRTTFLTQRDKH
jgi:MFS transporter, UMF1 family